MFYERSNQQKDGYFKATNTLSDVIIIETINL